MPTRTTESRHFTLFLVARLVSLVGSLASPIAIATALGEHRSGGHLLGLALAANIAPQIVLAPVAGVLADRYVRSRLATFGCACAGIGQATLAIGIHRGDHPGVIIASAVTGSGLAFSTTAIDGLLPRIVRHSQLRRANATFRLLASTFKIVVPAVAGLALAVLHPVELVAIDAGSFFASSVLWTMMKDSAPGSFGHRPHLVQEALEGVRWVASAPGVGVILIQGAVTVTIWLIGFSLLGPLWMFTHKHGPREWGIVLSSFAGGMITGSLVALRFRLRAVGSLVCLAGAMMAAPMLLMSADLGIAAIAMGAFTTGIAMDISIVAWTSYLQSMVPEDKLGKVLSLSDIAQLGLLPVGYILAGTGADHLGTTRLLAWIAGAAVFAGLAPLIFSSSVRRLRLDDVAA